MTDRQRARELLRIRLDRAREHVSELRADIEQWRAKHPILVRIEETGPRSFQIFGVDDMGQQYLDRWAFIVSDAIHHTRSALDNAVHALWVDHSGEPDTADAHKIAYPIYRRRGDYRRRRHALTSGCSPEVIRLIDDIQPWNMPAAEREYHAFQGLADLNNADKHKAPRVLALGMQHLVVGEAEDGQQWTLEQDDRAFLIAPGQLSTEVVLPFTPNAGDDLPIRINYQIGATHSQRGTVVRMVPVPEGLTGLIDHVDAHIGELFDA